MENADVFVLSPARSGSTLVRSQAEAVDPCMALNAAPPLLTVDLRGRLPRHCPTYLRPTFWEAQRIFSALIESITIKPTTLVVVLACITGHNSADGIVRCQDVPPAACGTRRAVFALGRRWQRARREMPCRLRRTQRRQKTEGVEAAFLLSPQSGAADGVAGCHAAHASECALDGTDHRPYHRNANPIACCKYRNKR